MGPKAPPKERQIRTTLLMPESLWRRAKVKALDADEGTMQAVMLHALEMYLSQKGGGHGRTGA